jgi:hypothetical protein
MYGGYPPPYWGAPFPAQWTAEQELEALKSQAQAMEQELQTIRKRIGDLKVEEKKD